MTKTGNDERHAEIYFPSKKTQRRWRYSLAATFSGTAQADSSDMRLTRLGNRPPARLTGIIGAIEPPTARWTSAFFNLRRYLLINGYQTRTELVIGNERVKH
ncbi:MAG: hypothetical protein V2A66_00785 [Pseudomonadota bacterium]